VSNKKGNKGKTTYGGKDQETKQAMDEREKKE
jgi:hypothetical protein